MAFYVLDENNNKVEAFDKEGVLAVLAQAIADGTLNNIVGDAAFVSKLKCCVGGTTNNVAFVTQAKYNELEAAEAIKNNTYYIITDDTTVEELNEILEGLNSTLEDLGQTVNELYSNKEKHQRFTFSNEEQSVGFTAQANSLITRTQDAENITSWTNSPRNIPISLNSRSIEDVVGISGSIVMYTMQNQNTKQYIHFQTFSRKSNGVWLSNVVFAENDVGVCCGELNFNLTSSTIALEEIKQYVESKSNTGMYLDLLLTELNIFFK